MRRVIWLPALLLVLLSAAYTAYWLHVRAEATRIIDAWVRAQARAGVDVAWRDRVTGGFPFRVTAQFDAPSVTVAGPGDARARRLAADGLDLHTLPYDLNHIIAQPRGVITAPDLRGGVAALQADRLRASYRLTRQGASRLAADSGPLEARWPLAAGDAAAFDAAPAALTAEAFELYVAQNDDDLSRVRAFGNLVGARWPGSPEAAGPDALQADLEVSASQAFLSARTLPAATTVWIRDGGAVTINTLAARWDEAALAVRGELSLTVDRTWTGALEIAIAQPDVVMNRLASLGLITPDTATAVTPLAVLAAGGDQRLELRTEIEAGVVSLLGIPLLTLPPAP